MFKKGISVEEGMQNLIWKCKTTESVNSLSISSNGSYLFAGTVS